MKNLLVSLILVSLSTTLLANGIGINSSQAGHYFQLIESKTSVVVNNQIARITSTQTLKNNSNLPSMLKYGFPLGESANAINMRWYIDGEWKVATVSGAEQDNSLPSGGNGGGGSSGSNSNQSLVDFLGDSPFFFSPKDTVAVDSIIVMEFTYVQLLPYYQGKVEFYQKGDISQFQSEPVELQTFEFVLESERTINSLNLIGLNATPTITTNSGIISYIAENENADFDYWLEYELSSTELGIYSLSTMIPDSLFNCDERGHGYLTFIIEPESNVDTEVIEKNFTLIIDRSGSMDGNKILQAKESASFIINNLNEGDFFNIIDFSTDVKSFATEHVSYDINNQNAALEYIESISSGGGTNISGPLLQAILEFEIAQQDKANIIIFMTDGQANAGITSTPNILDAVQNEVAQNETEIFLFTIGVGEGVDRGLLTLLAKENSGLVQFLEPNELETDLSNFFLSINNPVLLNTQITFTPDIITDIFPNPLPNLYKGQQMILSGRYEDAQNVMVKVEGKAFNVPVSYDFEISLESENNENLSFLPKIWAKQKIDELSLSLFTVSPEEEMGITEEIDSISTCFGVVDVQFSSFDDTTVTAIEETENETEKANALTIYPNPVADRIEILLNSKYNLNAEAQVSILNSQMVELIELDVQIIDNKIALENLERLPSGIYYIYVLIGEKAFIAKFIKI